MKFRQEKWQNSLYTLFWTGFIFSVFCYLLLALGSLWHRTSTSPWGFRVSINPPPAIESLIHDRADTIHAWRKWNRQPPVEPWTVSWPEDITSLEDINGEVRIESNLFFEKEKHFVCLLRANGPIRLFVNGIAVHLRDPKGHSNIRLAAGLNHIRILWSPASPKDRIRFTLREGFFDQNLPYHVWQRPDHSLAPFWSRLLKWAAGFQYWGFYLSLISCLILFGFICLKKDHQKEESPIPSPIWPGILSGFKLLSPFLILSFLNQFLSLYVPLLIVASLSALVVIIPKLVKFVWLNGNKSAEIKINTPQVKWISLLLVSIVFTLVSGLYIFGRVVPPTNLQLTDLSSHLDMSETILTQDHFLLGPWADYPQGPHAFLALLAKLFSSRPQTLAVPLLLVFYLFFVFLQFLLSQSLFPGLKWIWLPLGFILGFPLFFYTTMFRWFMFPAILSTTFLMAAILQHRSGHKIWGGLSLLAGITVYPLFAPIFLPIYLINGYFPLRNGSGKRKFIQETLGLLISSGILVIIYTLNYIQVHSKTHHQGSNYSQPLELFSVLGFMTSIMTLWGLYLAIKNRNLNSVWGLISLLIFIVIALVGQGLNLLSHYYIIKTLTPLSPFLLPFIAIGLTKLHQNVKTALGKRPKSIHR